MRTSTDNPFGGRKGLPATIAFRMAKTDLMDRVVNLAKRRGFVFPSSEIYGGFRSTWDYGPLGVLLKRNVKDAWWRSMVQLRDDIVGLDAAILMAPKVWEASGHVATFTDPLVDCRNCKERFRADQLPESGACPNCGAKDSFTEARQFNLMFKTYVGPVEDDAVGRVPAPGDRAGHLRQLPQRADDDAQEAAVRHRADRQVVPQRDHARATSSSAPASSSRWRWSSSCRPRTARSWYEYWCQERLPLVHRPRHPRGAAAAAPARPRRAVALLDRHRPTSSSMYPWGWGELEGIANRTDYDLTQHAKFSGQDLSLLRPGARPPLRAARDRARRRRRPRHARVPARGLRRGGGPNDKGGPRSARCCASTRASRRSRSRCSRCRRTRSSCPSPTRSRRCCGRTS